MQRKMQDAEYQAYKFYSATNRLLSLFIEISVALALPKYSEYIIFFGLICL